MFLRIEKFFEKKFIGKSLILSFTNNKTSELWSSFMPLRSTITNTVGSELYSIEVCSPGYFDHFDPAAAFEKWAVVEVTDHNSIPEGMKALTVPEGLYAVFLHKGPASEGPKTYEYIFGEWLPKSGYTVDLRPHIAIMGDKYKKEDPASEEEIWIAIKK